LNKNERKKTNFFVFTKIASSSIINYISLTKQRLFLPNGNIQSLLPFHMIVFFSHVNEQIKKNVEIEKKNKIV
jgi:hypothetical protein